MIGRAGWRWLQTSAQWASRSGLSGASGGHQSLIRFRVARRRQRGKASATRGSDHQHSLTCFISCRSLELPTDHHLLFYRNWLDCIAGSLCRRHQTASASSRSRSRDGTRHRPAITCQLPVNHCLDEGLRADAKSLVLYSMCRSREDSI